MVGCHDTEGYASLHPRLRATRYTRAFDLSGRAAGLFYHGFSQIWADLHSIVLICAMFVIICVFYMRLGGFGDGYAWCKKKDAIVHLARLHLLIFYPVWGELFYCANAFGI